MSLVDNITITRDETYKGPAYIAIGALTSFPGALESVIDMDTYALQSGITALCPTTEDGVTINRSVSTSDGIPIDQKNYNMDAGEPESWTMQVGFTLLNTDVDTIKYPWATPEPVTVTGSSVTQKKLPLGAPETFTERELYVIQEDPKTGRMRVFAFRKSIPAPDGDLNIQKTEASGLPVTFNIRPDTTLAEHHGPYGFIIEEDAS